jgi:hypothetical protein
MVCQFRNKFGIPSQLYMKLSATVDNFYLASPSEADAKPGGHPPHSLTKKIKGHSLAFPTKSYGKTTNKLIIMVKSTSSC